jgi:perosamine synthetase
MIKLDEPLVGKKEIKYLNHAIKSGWISSQGPFVKKLESKFAKYIGVKYAISCASGTGALSLLFKTLNLKKGDEVIMQSLTFSADGFALLQSGAKIIFADCKPGKFTVDLEDITKKITKKTKVISPTHLYGFPADMDKLKRLCKQKKIYLVEDCSQSTGTKYKGKMVGSFGDFNIHSFHNKLIASGEGGMITTNSSKLAKRFENLKNPPSVNRPEEMNFSEISMNHRMSNLHAAVGLAQLEKIESSIAKKIKMAKIYDRRFEKSKNIRFIKTQKHERVVYWRYTILLNKKINIDKFIKLAEKNGIITRKTYLPLHMHPVFKKNSRVRKLPNCEQISKIGLDIPSSIKMKNSQINFVANRLLKIADKLS